MVAPRSRLIYIAGLILLPLSLLPVFDPSLSLASAGAAAGLIFIAVLDALFSRARLRGIEASLPEVARLSKDRPGEIAVTLANKTGPALMARLVLAPPSALVSTRDHITTMLPEKDGVIRVPWPVTAIKRGDYLIENVFLEVPSLLGLWSIRRTAPARSQARVYPDVISERKHLAALFLNRGAMGVHARRQVGKGREFEKLREYMPGDGYEDIHWKATAKRGRPVTKMYQIERTQEVYVAIDASRLSAREVSMPSSPNAAGASITSQLERFITAAMVLGLVAEKQGDLFGLIAFDDQVRKFARARNGKAHYGACRDALYTLEPRLVNPDFGEIASYIRLRLRRRALLIFLTSLDDPVLAESFVRNLEALTRHHLVMVNMIATPGTAPLFSAPDAASADDLYDRLGGHLQWRSLKELEKVLGRRGAPLTLMDNERLCPQLVTQYLDVKRRQLL